MAKRKKSIEDIRAQAERIKAYLGGRGLQGEYGSPEFMASYNKQRDAQNKVEGIASRYISNIRRTASYRKASDAIQAATRGLNPMESAVKAARGIAELNDKQYSQSTYMGLSNG